MKEYVHKKISDSVYLKRKKADPVECTVVRSCNTDGWCEIALKIDGAFKLSIDTDTFGTEYEQVARQIGELWMSMVDKPCTIWKEV